MRLYARGKTRVRIAAWCSVSHQSHLGLQKYVANQMLQGTSLLIAAVLAGSIILNEVWQS